MFTRPTIKITLTFLFFSLFSIPVYAENIENIRTRQIEDGIYYLLYTRQQIQAIDNDMIFSFGWMPDDKKGMKKNAHDCIRELHRLKAKLMAKQMPLELAQSKEAMADEIEQQKKIYRGAELRTAQQISASYDEFQKVMDKNFEHFRKEMDRYLTAQRVPDDFSMIDEELKLFPSQEDKDLYAQAHQFAGLLQFFESNEILRGLLEKYQGTPAEPVIMLRMSDGFLNSDTDIENLGGELNTYEVGFEVLEELVARKEYSPVLYEAFDKWRCKYQERNHGMSNFSAIPNIQYNDRRMEIVKVIQRHLLQHPEDNWAKVQILSLLTLENIVRGDPFGNSNLRHLAAHYMNLDKVKKERSLEEKQKLEDKKDALVALEAPVAGAQ